MEFLRFGSSIPGSYWGCCACCIIQNFKVDPDAKASIEVVDGDGGAPIREYFLGKTYREIFESRLRIGTFNDDDMPDHAFLAILTERQLDSTHGSAWLKILKEHGFEFIRTVDNSVYSGPGLFEEHCEDEFAEEPEQNPNYLFGLFRNIGAGKIHDPFEPPAQWKELSGGVKEPSDYLTQNQRRSILESQDEVHLKSWANVGPAKFYTKEELENEGIPITMAGRRSPLPQQSLSAREATLEQNKAATGSGAKAAPFGGGSPESSTITF